MSAHATMTKATGKRPRLLMCTVCGKIPRTQVDFGQEKSIYFLDKNAVRSGLAWANAVLSDFI